MRETNQRSARLLVVAREDPTLEAALSTRFLQSDPANLREEDVPLVECDFVQAGGVALALAFELRKARTPPQCLPTVEEPVEGTVEIDECLLSDVGRHFVQPGAVAPL